MLDAVRLGASSPADEESLDQALQRVVGTVVPRAVSITVLRMAQLVGHRREVPEPPYLCCRRTPPSSRRHSGDPVRRLRDVSTGLWVAIAAAGI